MASAPILSESVWLGILQSGVSSKSVLAFLQVVQEGTGVFSFVCLPVTRTKSGRG